MHGPHVPAWQALRDALDSLVQSLEGATLAVVMDETPVLVCWSTPFPPLLDIGPVVANHCQFVYDRELASLARPLRRGGHVSVVRGSAPAGGAAARRAHVTALPGGVTTPRYIVESFASQYVIIVFFDRPIGVGQHGRVIAALPNLASLIAALPLPEPPATAAGARRQRPPKAR